MQPSLATLQADFRATVLGGVSADGAEPQPPAALLEAVNADGIPAERRLAIHRNHFATTLSEALGGVFEATRALLGAAYFDAFARRYVRANPPSAAGIFEYGGDLPAALAAAPGLADHGYVMDVARLEWAMHESFHAPAAGRLEPTRLTAVPSAEIANASLEAHPTVRLIEAAFPVHILWRGALDNAVDGGMVSGDPAYLIMSRPDLDVELAPLEPATFAFLSALFEGQSIGAAVELAAAQGEFDFGETLGNCLAQTVFADVVKTTNI
jgi:hypothetical protein